jgi:hypothetical protein
MAGYDLFGCEHGCPGGHGHLLEVDPDIWPVEEGDALGRVPDRSPASRSELSPLPMTDTPGAVRTRYESAAIDVPSATPSNLWNTGTWRTLSGGQPEVSWVIEDHV